MSDMNRIGPSLNICKNCGSKFDRNAQWIETTVFCCFDCNLEHAEKSLNLFDYWAIAHREIARLDAKLENLKVRGES
jgi:hypothetical protein